MPEITRDGVRLAYDEAGSGGPPLLFVHGFGGDAGHFVPQMEQFQQRRRVVAIDRRGHGRSDKAEGPYTIPAIADEVVWTARELGLHKPVLVVHSMGAIGFEALRLAPDFASALVIIDAPALPPPPVKEAFAQLLAGLRSSAYKEAIDGMCDRLIFLPTDDKTRRAKLHARLLETPQHVLVSTWEGFLGHDPLPAVKTCAVPVLYVGSVMPCNEAGMRELCPQITIGRSVGAGHFPQLEVADQVNGMIARFLQVNSL